MIASEKEFIHIQTPGRICLFGDHQDYLGLPVIACAINRHIHLKAEVNSEKKFRILLPDIQEERIIPITETLEALHARDYFASALRVVKRVGCIPGRGYNISISGNIPINSGVSSSSALVVAWIHFLLKAFGANQSITDQFIAKLAHEAEVLEHGEPGGKMDQYTISIGDIVYIETGDDFNLQKIGTELEGMILADSGVQKRTLGVLSEAKEKALKAIEYVQNHIETFELSKVRLAEVPAYAIFIPEELQTYFYAAVRNHMLTQKALLEFEKANLNLKKLGELMTQHHTVLKDKLHTTVPKIDAMIEAALQAGAYGAKIVGSGGGGSIVVLAPKEKELHICNALLKAGAKAAYPVSVAKGSLEL
ncbi:galactokinase [Ulvibacter sp. MAR_2010_11]|uniref:mevalonate kinase family protein n=1 Tax=Ulvibacter sp. MAR_2010_11 TaxID=1250229 RepID=UPI000CBA4367|nr:galactokinase family protein [Ulvibacter sp. MAR_2010_11]PKA82056.1 galactokinase [Ulvibacter sp. MAR_2010_11]